MPSGPLVDFAESEFSEARRATPDAVAYSAGTLPPEQVPTSEEERFVDTHAVQAGWFTPKRIGP